MQIKDNNTIENLEEVLKESLKEPIEAPAGMNIPSEDLDQHWLQERSMRKHYPEFHQFILDNFKLGREWMEKLYMFFHGLRTPKICPVCKKRYCDFLGIYRGYSKTCGYACGNIISQEQRKAFNQIKYGVDWVTQTDVMKEKSKEACRITYGVDNASQAPEIKKKKEKTCMKHYHVKNPSKSPEVQKKKEETCMGHYEVRSPFCKGPIRDRIIETWMGIYGVDNPSKDPGIQKKKEKTCEKNHKVKWGFLTPQALEANKRRVSKIELRYHKFIRSLFPGKDDVIFNDTDILGGYEMDIYIPSLKLAIEVNGNYYHRYDPNDPKNNDSLRHMKKWIVCFKKGITLLTVWDVKGDDGEFEMGCKFITDYLEGKPLDKYKKEWYPDLNENEHPLDLGFIDKKDVKRIKEIKPHSRMLGSHLCYDSGIITLKN